MTEQYVTMPVTFAVIPGKKMVALFLTDDNIDDITDRLLADGIDPLYGLRLGDSETLLKVFPQK